MPLQILKVSALSSWESTGKILDPITSTHPSGYWTHQNLLPSTWAFGCPFPYGCWINRIPISFGSNHHSKEMDVRCMVRLIFHFFLFWWKRTWVFASQMVAWKLLSQAMEWGCTTLASLIQHWMSKSTTTRGPSSRWMKARWLHCEGALNALDVAHDQEKCQEWHGEIDHAPPGKEGFSWVKYRQIPGTGMVWD